LTVYDINHLLILIHFLYMDHVTETILYIFIGGKNILFHDWSQMENTITIYVYKIVSPIWSRL